MVLSHDTIKEIALGVIFFEDGPNGGIIPRRFSPAQIDAYAYHEMFTVRTRAASGCCLYFETDASELVLKFLCCPGSSRDFYGFDLKVNGLLYAHTEDSYLENPEGEWRVVLPEGTKALKLYLPNLAGVEIKELALTGATVCKPLKHNRRILFMGDSITQGYTAHFPSGTYPAHVAAALDAEYLNQAIGAETFHPEILDPDLGWTPDLIILAYSTNDWALKTREVFIEDATEFVRRICAIWPGKPVVMLTPTWRADYLTRRDDDFLFMDVPGIMRDIAAQFPDTQVITGIDFVPWSLQLLDDHIHPNDLGFFYYAERLVTQLKANGLA